MLRAVLTILILLAMTISAAPHLGSPWHGPPLAAALGFNTVYLNAPDGAPSAKFQVRYPTQENTFDYRVGDTSSVIVFGNDELVKNGFITEQSAVLATENGTYNPSEPGNYEFTITKSGHYHVLFGPGPNTSILVIQTARTFDVVPITAGATVGKYMAPATSGDFHIIKHPTKGLQQFAGWYSVFYKEFTEAYRAAQLPTAEDMNLTGARAKAFAAALVERGYPQFAAYQESSKLATSPFLGHINGLNAKAFDTALLAPGEYTFTYRPAKIIPTIMQTNEIVLEVFPDDAFEKQYGTEQDILAKASFVSNQDAYSLKFKVEKTGYYHLGYGVGEGGFLFQMTPDENLPTEITTANGQVKSHTRLTGVNSEIVGQRPIGSGEWSVFFPCKVVQAKDHGAPKLASVSVCHLRLRQEWLWRGLARL